MRDTTAPLRVCILFGGPSDERNISAGSIKPWVTYLAARPGVALSVVFLDRDLRAHRLAPRWFYTNTCEDFESELTAADRLSEAELDALLAGEDLAIPIIHGRHGEDGELQRRLERVGVPYLFSAPDALATTLDKAATFEVLRAAGLPVPEFLVFDRDAWERGPAETWRRVRSHLGRDATPGVLCAVKPLRSGSSLGVSLVPDDADAFERAVAEALVHDDRVVVEEFLSGGEFSVVVLQDRDGQAVALAPTEVEKQDALYDQRAKYLQGEGARLHTPLRDAGSVEPVRRAAERAFEALGMRDMARIDGFLVGDRVFVTDVNGISGMGMSSFVFLQTAMVGISHRELIEGLVARRARRPLQEIAPGPQGRAERVHVLFGGATSERQVSRQSGVFVGLCLLARGFDVRFLLMDRGSRFTEVGLFYALHHDVEEIEALVAGTERRREIAALARGVAARLGAESGAERHLHVGATTDLAGAVEGADFAFLALHGGAGEDGTLQAALEVLGVPYNGAGSRSSRICSDKVDALDRVDAQLPAGVRTPRRRAVDRAEMLAWWRASRGAEDWQRRFAEFAVELDSPVLVVKPRADGCSTGVKVLRDGAELRGYVGAVLRLASELRAGELGPGSRRLKLPEPSPERWVLEQGLVEPDAVPLPAGDWNARNLQPWFARKRWVELTCGVLEREEGGFLAATPSVTVAASAELSLEEKFQQGTGTNLELSSFLAPERVAALRERVVAVAERLGIEGYARIDGFYDRETDEFIVLEPNTLCGLTEATVLYTQMLAAAELTPAELLERLVRLGQLRHARRRADRDVHRERGATPCSA